MNRWLNKMNYKELWDEGTRHLEEAGVPEPRLDAWYLLEYSTGITRTRYWLDPSAAVCCEQAELFQSLLDQRAQRIPLQQITHQAFFMGHEFYVDEHVLIPRQDTEILAEAALEKLKGTERPSILDLCTGSGCILLSLLAEITDAEGIGTDLSEDALMVARRNAKELGLDSRCVFAQGDLFSALDEGKMPGGDGQISGKYDMIVSNPPYIATEVIGTLSPEVRLHDPLLALDGGEDGLLFYRRIAQQAASYLKKGGWLIVETGWDQGDSVSRLFADAGFAEVSVRKDLGGLDRVVLGCLTEEVFHV